MNCRGFPDGITPKIDSRCATCTAGVGISLLALLQHVRSPLVPRLGTGQRRDGDQGGPWQRRAKWHRHCYGEESTDVTSFPFFFFLFPVAEKKVNY